MRTRIYRMLEPDPQHERRSEQIIDVVILALILFSVALAVVATVPAVARDYGPLLRGVQLFVTAVFTVEYALRVFSCTVVGRYAHPVWGRLRFVFTPMALVDLLAVLPFYIAVVVTPGSDWARAMLLLRILRLLKLFRYSRSLAVFAQVLRNKSGQLVAALSMTAVLLVLASSLVYFAEREAQPQAFQSIPETMWWGIVTLTTVGYGDVSPVTPLGQLFGAVTAVVGIGLVALPSGILASGFIEAFEGEDEDADGPASPQRCPHCDQPLP